MRVVRLLVNRNEADVLEANLRWYADLGIPTVAVDDGSTDGSLELLRAARGAGDVAQLVELPGAAEINYRGLLRAGAEVLAQDPPDVLLIADADEFFEPANDQDLLRAIEQDFAEGYNAIELRNMEFHMTAMDPADEPDVRRRLRYYMHWPLELQRIFAWDSAMDISRFFGHKPERPAELPARVSPRTYVSRHYPLRTPEQALRKLERARPAHDEPRAHNHYLRLRYGASLITDPGVLSRYDDDHAWNFDERPGLRWRLGETTAALVAADWRVRQLEAGTIGAYDADALVPRVPAAPFARVALEPVEIPVAGPGWTTIVRPMPVRRSAGFWLTGSLQVQGAANPNVQVLFADADGGFAWASLGAMRSASPRLLASSDRLADGPAPRDIVSITFRARSDEACTVQLDDLHLLASYDPSDA